MLARLTFALLAAAALVAASPQGGLIPPLCIEEGPCTLGNVITCCTGLECVVDITSPGPAHVSRASLRHVAFIGY